MASRPPLTTHQIETLEWIRDGHVESSPSDYSRRISAGWLARRDLVTVKGRVPNWTASLTAQGMKAIANSKADEQVQPQPASKSAVMPTTTGSKDDADQPPANEPVLLTKPKPKSEQLLESLLTDGIVTVDAKQYQSIQSQISFLNRRGLVPKEKEIEVKGGYWNSKEVIVKLVDRPKWQYIDLEPIKIPVSLAKPSAAVGTLQKRDDNLNMTTSCFRHALLLVQALSNACEERGYSIKGRPKNRYEWADGPKYRDDPQYAGHLEIGIGKDVYVLARSQESKQVPHAPTAREQRTGASRTFDYVKIDALKIRIISREASFWRHDWSELELGSGTEFLPRLLQELELRAQSAVEERERAEEKRDRTQREWEAAKNQAREQYIREAKLGLLFDQLGRRRLAAELTDFIIELRNRAAAVDEPFQQRAGEWIQWIEEYKAEIDPANHSVSLPGVPEPTSSDLEPHMNGWSTEGPYKATFRPVQATDPPTLQVRPWHPNRRGWW
ncbi:hypothetical protein [Arthrobacter sp. KNU40]|uniref:hypothetical protein n=1 Tax=Arthrobacter sp. KNU40 TaxID=3447965 RepID=UPI003F613A2D